MSLQAIDLSAGYNSSAVLSHIDVSIEPGTLTILIGANGCGKSTLLRTLTGVQPPVAGRVMLDGRDVHHIDAAEKARLLSMVLTDRTGGGGLTVAEVVAIGRHPYSGFFGRLHDDDRQAIDEALQAVGLSHKRDSFVASLSDGERQKAMIARAMAQKAPLMVLDEPTSFLDVAARFDIMSLLKDIAASGTAVLLSTHDIAPAIEACDHIWAVARKNLLHGRRDEIIASGVLDTVYEGARFDAVRCDFVAR